MPFARRLHPAWATFSWWGFTLIEVIGLNKRFRGANGHMVTAVDDLNFRVEPGEVFGLLGPNGAGKTTTIRALTSLIRPTSGDILLNGVDAIKKPRLARAHIGYVPAEAGLPPQLTPREVVTLFARMHALKHPHRRAVEMLEKLDMGHAMDVYCESLSTGMKRRVVLARALVHDPQILLLDEPTDGLDVPGRRTVLDLVREQAAAGKTVLFSSHIMSEVERVADRIGVMAHGRLLAQGSIEELLQRAGTTSLDDVFLSIVSAA